MRWNSNERLSCSQDLAGTDETIRLKRSVTVSILDWNEKEPKFRMYRTDSVSAISSLSWLRPPELLLPPPPNKLAIFFDGDFAAGSKRMDVEKLAPRQSGHPRSRHKIFAIRANVGGNYPCSAPLQIRRPQSIPNNCPSIPPTIPPFSK
jgi:hypothetical protein